MSERPRDRRFPLTLDAVVERKPADRQRETRISSGVSAISNAGSRPAPARAVSAERAPQAPSPAPQRVAGVDAVVGAVAASAVQARTQAANAAAVWRRTARGRRWSAASVPAA